MLSSAALGNVLWIGGPPGAGKTSVASRLARRYGLRLYSADTQTWRHRDQAVRAGHPLAIRWAAMTPAQRWEGWTPEELLALSLHDERGPMVLADLRQLPAGPLVVAEGSTLPTDVVARGVADPARTVWLLPTVAFQRRALTATGVPPGPASLYRLLRERAEREAAAVGLPVTTLDGSLDIDQMVGLVADRFASALSAGPCARGPAERRGLLREANLDRVRQVLGWWAYQPESDRVPRAELQAVLLCECGEVSCTAETTRRLDAWDEAAVIANAHRGTSSSAPGSAAVRTDRVSRG